MQNGGSGAIARFSFFIFHFSFFILHCPVLIIGYGNPLRRDDGLGWCAARRLMETLPDDQAEVVIAHQLAPEMAEAISRARLVIFIDASQDGTPGQVVRQSLSPGSGEWGALVHHLDAASLLACARELYGKCPPAIMLSVVAQSFEFGEGLSPVVQAGLEEVLRLVHQELASISSV